MTGPVVTPVTTATAADPVDALISGIIDREGRTFTNRSADRGGPTKFGITAKTLGAWRHLGRPANAAEVRDMPEAEAWAIYRAEYVAQPGFGRIEDAWLRTIVVDSGVLHGVHLAAMWLQKALGVAQDGAVGAQTLAALTAADPALIARRVLACRFRSYGLIVTRDHEQLANINGWLNRAADLLTA